MAKQKRRKWVVAGGVLAVFIFAVGAVTLIQKALAVVTPAAKSNTHKLTVVEEASHAGFPYLVPKTDPAWQFDASSPVFDQSKGVVKYKVTFKDDNAALTISQQKLPDDLKPVPTSGQFNKFIIASNVNFSEPVGPGKAFFREALQNGVPAKGATTVIFATNDVLLFGQTGTILSYDKWAKLLASMQLIGGK